MTAVQAALAALIARETTGRGQYVEVPLFDTGFAMTLHAAQGYLIDGVCPQRAGNGSILASPIGVFQGADGPFFLTIGGERPWRRLVGRSEEHTSELQSLMRISYAVSCLKKKNK